MGRLSNVWTFGGVVYTFKRGKRPAAAGLLLFLSVTTAHAAGLMRPFHFGLWSGGAYTNEQTGSFSHCAAIVPYNSGILMAATVNRFFQWSLAFTHPQWALTPKSQIPVELHFDGGPPFSVVGTAKAPSCPPCGEHSPDAPCPWPQVGDGHHRTAEPSRAGPPAGGCSPDGTADGPAPTTHARGE
jgi:hypothetical protein